MNGVATQIVAVGTPFMASAAFPFHNLASLHPNLTPERLSRLG